MHIREVEKADFDCDLVECLNALGPTAFVGDRGLIIERLLQNRKAHGVRTFVALGPYGNVVGTASVYVEPKFLRGGVRAAHVEDVAVHPDCREMGVGKALVERCVLHAREEECYKVVLNCDPKNAPFYERCGFRVTPDSFMRLDLSV